MTHATDFHRINDHYARPHLEDFIFNALRGMGKDPEHFDYDDLGPVDQFHSMGKEATLALAELAQVQAGMRVLDIGGGLGGAARTLAAEYGCAVTVLDVTEEYCRVGELLTRRAGLADRVSFHHGDGLHTPFVEQRFDLVWTQHCTMNIEDKAQLYREIHRVLQPAGRLAMHEIMAGPAQPIHFPVPWATSAELSFLRPPASVQRLIEESGFENLEFRDITQTTHNWFLEHYRSIPECPPPLGLHLLVWRDFATVFGNVLRNVGEGRVAIVQGVFAKC